MTRSSKAAVDFIDHLCDLAKRLATKDLVVSQLHCDWRSFGSWTFEVQRGPAADAYSEALLRRRYDTSGPDVLRFDWDGKEKLLSVSTAPTEPLTSPGPWKRLFDQSLAGNEQAVAFAEEYAVKWGSPAA